jgi:predicted naringenin-chalcone synthase
MAEAVKIAAAIPMIDHRMMRAAKQTCLLSAEVSYFVAQALEYSLVDQLRFGHAPERRRRRLVSTGCVLVRVGIQRKTAVVQAIRRSSFVISLPHDAR